MKRSRFVDIRPGCLLTDFQGDARLFGNLQAYGFTFCGIGFCYQTYCVFLLRKFSHLIFSSGFSPSFEMRVSTCKQLFQDRRFNPKFYTKTMNLTPKLADITCQMDQITRTWRCCAKWYLGNRSKLKYSNQCCCCFDSRTPRSRMKLK